MTLCFETLYYLLYKKRADWSDVSSELWSSPEEFIEKVCNIDISKLNENARQLILNFSENPECSFAKVGLENDCVRPFCQMLHFMS